MIEVEKNSYITIDEADGIITRLCPLDSGTAYWDALDEEQKAAFLEQSCREIELTPKAGHKVYPYQLMEYPRRARFKWPADVYEVPREVKEAQALNAFALMKIRLGGVKDGVRLTSARAEQLMGLWFNGGF